LICRVLWTLDLIFEPHSWRPQVSPCVRRELKHGIHVGAVEKSRACLDGKHMAIEVHPALECQQSYSRILKSSTLTGKDGTSGEPLEGVTVTSVSGVVAFKVQNPLGLK
jgi:hypothetical protein